MLVTTEAMDALANWISKYVFQCLVQCRPAEEQEQGMAAHPPLEPCTKAIAYRTAAVIPLHRHTANQLHTNCGTRGVGFADGAFPWLFMSEKLS
jgi:hypothetical protein